jgi:23S rRNA (cytidine2498-2'-O)-methyltransferase
MTGSAKHGDCTIAIIQQRLDPLVARGHRVYHFRMSETEAEPSESSFLFVCCQVGAEPIVKAEVVRQWPQSRFAFSRPGFVTFKLPGEIREPLYLKSVFARTFGWSVGHVSGEQLPRRACQLLAGRTFHQVHVWPRDTRVPGDRGFMPGCTPQSTEAGEQLIAEARRQGLVKEGASLNRSARMGENVLDCVLVEPTEWWIGRHQASCFGHRWPGGVITTQPPDDVVSRAYLKTEEALRWSRLPIRRGDRCVEIGSAPGGSCQYLLEQGLTVTGVDPSEMDPRVIAHPNFTHIRKRGADLRRREYGGFQWLIVDSNVAPNHTLDTVESIVTHEKTNIRGMLVTLKLLQWDLTAELPAQLDRIRSWGYEYVRCRQLAFQRQEVCVAALRSRSMRRPGPKRRKKVSH